MPAQANAELTKVVGAGVADDWDVPGGPGAPKFEGTVVAYYREKIDRERDGEAVNIFLRRELIIDTADYDALELDTDDYVTFALDGHGPQTGQAVSIRRSDLAGIPAELRTTLIRLEDG